MFNLKRKIMPIKFRPIEKGQPGVVGGGTKQWYAITVNDQRVGIKDLTVEIERISTVNRADIQAVLSALVQLIPEKLTNSAIVQLGDLGYFRTNLSSEGAATAEEVSSNSIKGNRVVFTPGSDIRKALKNATYQKIS